MKKGRVLITGGAGFIGSHVVDELIENGYYVRIYDNLSPQVHGVIEDNLPPYIHPRAEFIPGDIRDGERLRHALRGMDYVVHLAAAVGVGQSMYEIDRYTSVNTQGTAVLMEALAEHPVKKMVVASGMDIYGEGLYHSSSGRVVTEAERSPAQLREGFWDLYDQNGDPLIPIPTPESKSPGLTSVYALNKYDQERLCLMVGRAYDIPTVALRIFNTYGPRQAISNPYTGVLAIFASRLLNDKPPMIFEDGNQRRDFVSVHDVARAFRLSLESPNAQDCALNIGGGRSYTISEVAEMIAQVLGKSYIEPRITGRYRTGDIRHCFADIEQARKVLGYTPQISLTEGLDELAEWLEGQMADDHVEAATSELMERGLAV